MALSFPLEFLDQWPGIATARLAVQEELSSQRGKIRTADIGDPYWMLDAQSRLMKPNEFRRWRAMLTALDHGKNEFRGRDIMGCRPILYPAGSTFGNAGAEVVSTADFEVVVSGLDSGVTISQGDFLSIEASGQKRSYHQVTQDATETGGSITLPVEPTPATWVVASDTVNFVNPEAIMIIAPGSLSVNERLAGGGTISFKGIET